MAWRTFTNELQQMAGILWSKCSFFAGECQNQDKTRSWNQIKEILNLKLKNVTIYFYQEINKNRF